MDTFSTCHERKPRLHDGTVTEDTDKYRLVRIPSSGREPPVVRFDKDLGSTLNAAIIGKEL